MSLFIVIIFYTYCIIVIKPSLPYDEDKLLLSPMEFIDMINKERSTHNKAQTQFHDSMRLGSLSSESIATEAAELNDDEETLRRRKVWSRWGKWGGCSVTCGSGVMTRQRLCAGGRCAHGELQQQRRPCSRPPCGESRPEHEVD